MAEPLGVKVQVGVETTATQFQQQINTLAESVSADINVNLVSANENAVTGFTNQIQSQLNNAPVKINLDQTETRHELTNIITDLNTVGKTFDGLKARYGNNPAFSQYANDIKQIQVAFSELDNVDKSVANFDKFQGVLTRVGPATEQLKTNLANLNKETTNFNQNISNSIGKNNLLSQMQDYLNNFPKVDRVFGDDIRKLMQSLDDPTVNRKEVANDFAALRGEIKSLGLESKTTGEQLRDAFGKHLDVALVMVGIHALQQAISGLITNVVELDAAMTNLEIASGKTGSEVASLARDYVDIGKEIGTSTTELLNSATEWSRQGFNTDEIETLIQNSTILSKVGMTSIEEATQYLTSAMKGFNVSAEDSIRIIDRLSAVDLEAAVSAGGLAEAMARTSASAQLAGVDMDRLIGYIATVGEVTQRDMSTVGESFKTLFARMGNVKLGRLIDPETSEDLSNVEATLRGLDIRLRDSDSEFRDFGDVLDEVGSKWDEYSSVQQRAIAVAFAGVRNQENFLVLMQNYDRALGYMGTSADSSGIALEKFGIYQDSLAAKSESLVAALQGLTMTLIDSDLVKGFLDFGTALISGADGMTQMLGVLPSLTTGLSAILSMMGKTGTILSPAKFSSDGFSFGNNNFKQLSQQIKEYNSVSEKGYVQQIRFNNSIAATNPSLLKYFQSVQSGNATLGGYTASLVGATVKTIALQAATIALNATITLGLSFAIQGIISMVGSLINANEEARQKALETVDAFKESENETRNNISTFESLEDEFARLSRGVDENGKRISLTSEEYARYQEIITQMVDLFPELVKGYNDEGEAIVNNNTLIQDAIDLQKELNKQKSQEYLSSGTSIYADVQKQIEETQKEIDTLTEGDFTTLSLPELLQKELDDPNGFSRQYRGEVQNLFDDLEIEYTIENDRIILEDYNQFIEKQEQIIALAKERGMLDAEGEAQLREQLALIEVQTSNIDTQVERLKEYLSFWASQDSNSDWYGEIPVDYFDEFDAIIKQIASDTNLTLSEMQAMIIGVGEEFAQVRDSIPTDEISKLQEDLASGAITQEQFNEQMEQYVADIFSLSDAYSTTNPELAEFIRLIAKNYEGLILSNGQSESIIQSLSAIASAFAQITDQEIKDGLQDLYERLSYMNSEFQSGNIDAAEYFNSIQSGINSIDWDNLEAGTEEMDAAMASFSSLVMETAYGIETLQNGFREGTVSMEDYLAGLIAAGESQMLINEKFLETNESMYESTAAYDTARQSIEAQNQEIQNSIDIIGQYSDSLIYLAEIGANGWSLESFGDEAQLMAQEIANSLYMIADAGNTAAQSFIASAESQYGTLYDYLLSGSADFSQAAQIISQQANIGITGLMYNVGNAISSLGSAIKNFDMTIDITPTVSPGSSIDLGPLGSISLPKISYEVSTSGSGIDQIGSAIEDIGFALSNNQNDFGIQLGDFSNSINKGSNALHNLGNAAGGAGDATKALNEELKRQKEILKEQEDAINDLLEMTIKMIKKEKQLQKEALQDELDGYKKIIEARKQLLRLQEEERDYQQELAEANKEVSDIESELVAIQFDDSEAAQRRRLELQEQLTGATNSLNELQHDREVELSEDALDTEYERFEELQKAKIEAIDRYLDMEGQIRQDAIALIEARTQEFYNRLLEWNRAYNTGVDIDVVNAWNNAYNAMMAYNNGQLNVLSTLAQITARMKELENAANAAADAQRRAGSGSGSNSSSGGVSERWGVFREDGSMVSGPFSSSQDAHSARTKAPGYWQYYTVKKYARGLSKAKASHLGAMDEPWLGDEMFIKTANGSRLKRIEVGDSILPVDFTKTLTSFAKNPLDFIKNTLIGNVSSVMNNNTSQPVAIDARLIVQGNIADDVLPKLQDMMEQQRKRIFKEMQGNMNLAGYRKSVTGT